jgi:hypothetical protein
MKDVAGSAAVCYVILKAAAYDHNETSARGASRLPDACEHLQRAFCVAKKSTVDATVCRVLGTGCLTHVFFFPGTYQHFWDNLVCSVLTAETPAHLRLPRQMP